MACSRRLRRRPVRYASRLRGWHLHPPRQPSVDIGWASSPQLGSVAGPQRGEWYAFLITATRGIDKETVADAILKRLSPTFDTMYSRVGRPSIPPERLLKSMVLMALYTVRSERLFCEQLDYNMLFRWFLDMNLEEPSFDHSTFSQNRERLLKHDVAAQFFLGVVEEARAAGLMSDEHFTVDGTLIEAWASLKSFRRKDDDGQKHS